MREFVLGCALIGGAFVACAEKFVPIMPSYLLLITIGLTSAQDSSQLAAIILATTMRSTLEAVAWYGLGHAFGAERCERLVRRVGHFIFLPIERYNHLTELYQRNSFWVTLVAQTIPTVRIYVALPAGVIGLAFIPFLGATIAGTVIWNAPLLSIGYALQGSSQNPVVVALAIIVAIVALEAAALFAMRHAPSPEGAAPARLMAAVGRYGDPWCRGG